MDTGLHRTAAVLPDEGALRRRVAVVWETEQTRVREQLQPLLTALQLAQSTLVWSGFVLAVVSIGLSLLLWPEVYFEVQPTWFAIVAPQGTLLASVATVGVLGMIMYRLYQYWSAYQQFVQALNAQLYPLLGAVFQYPALHQQTAADHVSVQTILQNVAGVPVVTHDMVKTLVQLSGLYTDHVTTYKTDDVLKLFVGDRPLMLAELQLSVTHQRDKHQETKQLFSGVFVHYLLSRPLTGQTYVSTEGDKHGFAHRTFWNTLTGITGVEETQLESNAFERDLHVASSDPIEARYILTPNFMEHLHEWWQEHRQSVRIAFKGQEFFMLLPDAHIKLNATPHALTDAVVIEYLYTLARPVWRTLRLLEDMRL